MKVIGWIFIIAAVIAAAVTAVGWLPEENRPLVLLAAAVLIAVGMCIFLCKKILSACKNIRFLKKEKMNKPEFAEAVDPMTGEKYTYLKNSSDRPLSEKAQQEITEAYKKGERTRNSKALGRIVQIVILLAVLLVLVLFIVIAVIYLVGVISERDMIQDLGFLYRRK